MNNFYNNYNRNEFSGDFSGTYYNANKTVMAGSRSGYNPYHNQTRNEHVTFDSSQMSNSYTAPDLIVNNDIMINPMSNSVSGVPGFENSHSAAAAAGRGLQITNMANVVLNQITSTPFNPQVYTMTKTTTASTTTIPKEYKGYHPMRKSLAKQEEEDNKNQELQKETVEKHENEEPDRESVGVQESETNLEIASQNSADDEALSQGQITNDNDSMLIKPEEKLVSKKIETPSEKLIAPQIQYHILPSTRPTSSIAASGYASSGYQFYNHHPPHGAASIAVNTGQANDYFYHPQHRVTAAAEQQNHHGQRYRPQTFHVTPQNNNKAANFGKQYYDPSNVKLNNNNFQNTGLLQTHPNFQKFNNNGGNIQNANLIRECQCPKNGEPCCRQHANCKMIDLMRHNDFCALECTNKTCKFKVR